MALKGKRLLKFYCDDCLLGIRLVPKLNQKVDNLIEELEKLKKESPPPAQSSSQIEYEEVLQEIEERNRRKQNIIIFGLTEDQSRTKQEQIAHDTQEVKSILQTLSTEIDTNVRLFRLGKFDPTKDRPRPVKVSLRNNQDVLLCIKNSAKLTRRSGNRNTRISISTDRTPKQQEFYRKVKHELDQRIAAGEKNIRIKYVHGLPKIVANLN
ncbi:unnamed protein product [Acanthoscelides obtectus]|uniref:Endonuclease-reverse transcriptase n=1 Tax=Acanthoscelides obtectus TaxID=200917 RepID=A0A9P0QIV5_ACAOB|nr:unnamed protein product [Acanthoscelides obtectus]CAK1684695.1 hypothetical protein AOBTE_LOCUS35041 [Acanthoscelides obtectus]